MNFYFLVGAIHLFIMEISQLGLELNLYLNIFYGSNSFIYYEN